MTDALAAHSDRWPDWRIESWDGWALRVVAGNSIAYGPEVEVVFSGVVYLASPMLFHWPVFREPTDDERAMVQRALAGDLDGTTMWCWDHDDGVGICAAESVASEAPSS